MIEKNQTTGRALMKGFINVDDPIFLSKWGNAEEDSLKHIKNELNKMDYKVLEGIKDPRILCQLILDFFENLALPSLRFESLKLIEEEFDDAKDISKLDEEVIFSLLSRVEFYLLFKFSSILSAMNAADSSTIAFSHQFGKRVALSLLLQRKKHSSIFNGRNMQSSDIDSKHVTCISEIIVWFSRKPAGELEIHYRSCVNTIMNRSPSVSSSVSDTKSNPNMLSPPTLSKFSQYKGGSIKCFAE
jgi:hypothetical protein